MRLISFADCVPQSHLLLLVCSTLLLTSVATAATTCDNLASLSLPDTKITFAKELTGTFTPPGEKLLSNLPAFCRVAGVIAPTPDSHIEFEVWMPAANWNHKFQGSGNGGFAGAISYGSLAGSIQHGYAGASTDTGHKGTGIDARWALGHPEKIVDFGYRAIHEMTVKAKAIIQAYYGEGPRRSYFASCSNGGRQALMEAQRYPADYDGIIAGAPAYDWTGTMADFVWNTLAQMDPAGRLNPSKITFVDQAVLAACDAKDGVKDGVVDDPRRCNFDPSSVVCKPGESDKCLTAPQAEALKKIYSGPKGGAGFSPGGETGPGGWGLWITGQGQDPTKSLQGIFATQFYENMVINRTDWDIRTFDFDRDMKLVNEKMAPILNATDTNLKAFKDRGGKLILFHGWADAALQPVRTIDYYNGVRKTMGAKSADSFARLYMMPGLQHCLGGPGTFYCGGLGAAEGDPEHDFSAAVEKWVEKGVAPGRMIAVKPAKDADWHSAVVRSRPICPYPQEAVYRGSGSTDDPANFKCEVRK
jgi:hypothetical protein